MVGLGQEGNDGDTGVTANYCDLLVRGVGALELRDETGGTNDVEGGDTEEALGIIDTLGLENLFYPAIRTPCVRTRLEEKRHTSAVIGTVEFTGLAITRMLALGAWSAAALAKSRTMEALVLNKSVNKNV